MKLSIKSFSQRYPYWLTFGDAFYLFKDCEHNSIFRADLLLSDKSKITSYFAYYPDTYGFPFDKLVSASICRYTLHDFDIELSHLVTFIRSLTAKQFNSFLLRVLNSGHSSASYNSFLIHTFHEI